MESALFGSKLMNPIGNTQNLVLNSDTAAIEADRFISNIPECKHNYQGRGILICAGGEKYFTGIWVLVKMIRHLNCKLPIELWYLGEHELSNELNEKLAEYNVNCIDAIVVSKHHPARILRELELKPFAIEHSSFEEILVIDPDCIPLNNPDYLFENHQYIKSGALFWSIDKFTSIDNPIWSVIGYSASKFKDVSIAKNNRQLKPNVYEVSIAKPNGIEELDTCLMLIHKRKCWRFICLLLWYNDYSDFFYLYSSLGKDTYRNALLKTKTSYYICKRRSTGIHNLFFYNDPAGDNTFQCSYKWDFYSNNYPEDASFNEVCNQFITELRSWWNGKTCVPSRYRSEEKTEEIQFAAEQLLEKPFIYNRVGYDQRAIVFLPDGTIGLGSAGLEVYWNLTQESETYFLDIYSSTLRTCRLRKVDDKWIGYWDRFEKMPIEVYPNDDEQTYAIDLSGYMETFCPASGYRKAFLHLFNQLVNLDNKTPVIVEFGAICDSRISSRDKDGWSTLSFGWFVSLIGGALYTIDSNEFHLRISKDITEYFASHITFINCNNGGWDKLLPDHVDLLYLDIESDIEQEYIYCYYSLFSRPKMIGIPKKSKSSRMLSGLQNIFREAGYTLLSADNDLYVFTHSPSQSDLEEDIRTIAYEDIVVRISPEHMYTREYKLQAYTHDKGDFRSLKNTNVLIYWPHGLGDFVFLSSIISHLEPTNRYWITRFGDDSISLFDGCESLSPIYIGINHTICNDGGAYHNRHFGLDIDRIKGGDEVTLNLPESLYKQCVENKIGAIFWTSFFESWGYQSWPYHTKGRYLLSHLHNKDAFDMHDLHKPLSSIIPWNSGWIKRWVEARLSSLSGYGRRRLCLISRNGYTCIQKNWGHLWREEMPVGKQYEGEECKDFMKLMLRKDPKWMFLFMEDRVCKDSMKSDELNSFSYAELFTSMPGGAPPFGMIVKALIELADLVIGVPTGPYHLAMAKPEVPVIGIWTSHLPDWYDEPKENAIHLIGRNVINEGMLNRVGSNILEPGWRHKKIFVNTNIIPGSDVFQAVEQLI